MSACVVCLRPVEDSCPAYGLCRECQESYDSNYDPSDDGVVWAAQRAREFAYEDAARVADEEAATYEATRLDADNLDDRARARVGRNSARRVAAAIRARGKT